MNTLIIDGHPNPDSLCAAIAANYAEGHGDATIVALRDLQFEPSLHFGYTRRQELEPDLERTWKLLLDARHVVVVTPVWWGSVPTLLKGFFDRLLLPRRAYQLKKNGIPEGLLTGRTGRVIVTADSPPWYLRLVGDTTVRHVRDRTLAFCGIKPVQTTRFGPVKSSTLGQREGWLAKSASLGHADAARLTSKRTAREAVHQ